MDTQEHNQKTGIFKYSFTGLFRKGIHFIYFHFLIPKSEDEDKRRREFILNIILCSTIVMFVLLNGLIIFDYISEGVRYQGSSISSFLIPLLIFICLYFISRVGHFIISSYVLISIYFLAIS